MMWNCNMQNGSTENNAAFALVISAALGGFQYMVQHIVRSRHCATFTLCSRFTSSTKFSRM